MIKVVVLLLGLVMNSGHHSGLDHAALGFEDIFTQNGFPKHISVRSLACKSHVKDSLACVKDGSAFVKSNVHSAVGSVSRNQVGVVDFWHRTDKGHRSFLLLKVAEFHSCILGRSVSRVLDVNGELQEPRRALLSMHYRTDGKYCDVRPDLRLADAGGFSGHFLSGLKGFSGSPKGLPNQYKTTEREDSASDGPDTDFSRPFSHFRLRFEVLSSLIGLTLSLFCTFCAYQFADRGLDALNSGNKARFLFFGGLFIGCVVAVFGILNVTL